MGTWIVLGLVTVVLWLGHCLIYPRQDCRTCKGSGKIRSGVAWRTHRRCTECDGEGWRLRWGYRLIRNK